MSETKRDTESKKKEWGNKTEAIDAIEKMRKKGTIVRKYVHGEEGEYKNGGHYDERYFRYFISLSDNTTVEHTCRKEFEVGDKIEYYPSGIYNKGWFLESWVLNNSPFIVIAEAKPLEVKT